jgi:DNA mismatch repair protein MutS2
MVLMAQAGFHLPAVEARLTVFDQVFADIGDEQSIEQSLSTFSSHITNIIRILAQVDDRSLVVLDELGSGTDPAEGAALAQAITNYLRDKGATTFIATHYPELKLYASRTEGAVNASLIFDLETLSPTYEMTIGIPGRSNALAIARRLGLDETILHDALQMMGHGSQKAEDVLDSIYALRDKMESEEAGTRLALQTAEQERNTLGKRLEEIEVERRQILAEARARAQAELEQVREEIRQARRKVRDAASLNQLKKVSQAVTELEEEAAKPVVPAVKKAKKPYESKHELQVGDIVYVKSLDVKGEVVNIQRKEAQVAVGRLQMRANLKDLEFRERPSEEEGEIVVKVPSTPAAALEFDMRGMRVEEGLAELDRFLDSAFRGRMPWVRIIHGKGTGKLKDAVRQALRQNSHITSWEEGKDGEGGAGVTVVKFEEG